MSCNRIPVRYTVPAVLCQALAARCIDGSSTLKTVACLGKLGDNWHAYKNGDGCYLNGHREPFSFERNGKHHLNGNGSETFTPFFNCATVRKRERFSDAYCTCMYIHVHVHDIVHLQCTMYSTYSVHQKKLSTHTHMHARTHAHTHSHTHTHTEHWYSGDDDADSLLHMLCGVCWSLLWGAALCGQDHRCRVSLDSCNSCSTLLRSVYYMHLYTL